MSPKTALATSFAAAAAATTETTAPAILGYIGQLRNFSTCDVGDALVRLGTKYGGHLYGLSAKRPPTAANDAPWKICGPALTVRMCNYGGGLGQAKQPHVDYSQPGKIMVIETPEGKGSKYAACWGVLESIRAKMLQAEGVVVGGNMRQVRDCYEVGFPVFARGTAALGAREFMRLAKVGDTIKIGGVEVHNDDVVLADEEGVVVVRERRLADVIKACEFGVKYNKVVRQAVKSGATAATAFRHADTLLGKDTHEKIGPSRR